jgi:hypothetical protein
MTIAILAFYILRGDTNTTVIPCVNHTWYKIYTGAFFVMMVILLMVSALETGKTPCGTLTTALSDWD